MVLILVWMFLLTFHCYSAEWAKKWLCQGRNKIVQRINEDAAPQAPVVINHVPVVEAPEPSSIARSLMSLKRMSDDEYYNYLINNQVVLLGQEQGGSEHEKEITVVERNGTVEFIEVVDTQGKKHILADTYMRVKHYHPDIVSYRPIVQDELQIVAALYAVDRERECYNYRKNNPGAAAQDALEYVQKEESARLQRLAQDKGISPATIALVEQKNLMKLPSLHERVILRQHQEKASFKYIKPSLNNQFQFVEVQ